MRIFIIGLPGVGKSTLSSFLAQKIEVEPIDLDAAIQLQTGLSIPQIFEQGEKIFRDYESTALLDVISKNKEIIVACGGGTPCYNNNMQVMKNNGIVVYLKADIDVVKQRLQGDRVNIRPLFEQTSANFLPIEDRLQRIYADRKGYYEDADLTIDWNAPFEGRILESLIDEIINFTKDECKRN